MQNYTIFFNCRKFKKISIKMMKIKKIFHEKIHYIVKFNTQSFIYLMKNMNKNFKIYTFNAEVRDFQNQ